MESLMKEANFADHQEKTLENYLIIFLKYWIKFTNIRQSVELLVRINKQK